MARLRKKLSKKPKVALSIAAILCAITFVTNLINALTDGKIDSTELHALLALVDSFEGVVLFIIMFVLNVKKK